ncbi:DNA glycosylase AlkZ-like family protein [Streptomyces chrestomyceticus]|uniref:Uncharacterized protein n=1 Tax=Streptomyces chrestomyceticus TaxID=68185 RepID=A0ABU7WRW8_9ACTN
MHSTLTLPAAVERAAIANRHGWGPQPGPAGLAALATAQAGLHAARLLTPYVTAHTRLPEFRADDLRHALSPHGMLVKVRCVRRTLHLWPHEHAADAHTATLRLRLGATLATARRHGLNRNDLETTGNQCQEALAGGPLATTTCKTGCSRPLPSRRSQRYGWASSGPGSPAGPLAVTPPRPCTASNVSSH